MKTASFALAALLLAAPTAFAQTTTPADKPAVTTTADGHFYSHRPGEMRASKLIGTNVTNAANEVSAGGAAAAVGVVAQFVAEASRIGGEIDSTITEINQELQG